MGNGANGGDDFELHAFVDGELDSERRRAVEDRLVQQPEKASLVEGWRRQNAALRAAFAHVAQEPLPAMMRLGGATSARSGLASPDHGLIETGVIHWGRPSGATRTTRRVDALRRNRQRTILSWLMTGLVCVFIAGAAFIVFTGSATQPERPELIVPATSFVTRADLTYLTFARDARPVEIGGDRLGELAEWLHARTGLAKVPDLSASGLRLLGGRLAPGAASAAGFLLYETPTGARVGLYFEPIGMAGAPPSSTPRATAGMTAIEWRTAGLDFVLIGPLPSEEMQAAAERAATEALAPRPAQGGNGRP
jgi:anti-sigma factor RsiW